MPNCLKEVLLIIFSKSTYCLILALTTCDETMTGSNAWIFFLDGLDAKFAPLANNS